MNHTIRIAALAPTLALVLGLALGASPAPAHEGHDHGAEPATPMSGAPQRLPDGTLLLPKASQRQLAVRTEPVLRGPAARAIELPGRVAIEPAAAGRVQASLAGRLEPGPQGLPTVGQTVARGQVLAIVRPTIDPVERAARDAELAELRAAHALAGQRLARLRSLSDTVPRREIEAVESEAASLAARIAALSQGVAAVERLVAPVSGVIASADAIAGQVVEPRERLFEIVDPARLRIEATGFDPALAAQVGEASILVDGTVVPLGFVGAGRVLREQALPLVFSVRHPAVSALAVGQPLAVTVRLRSSAEGVALPLAAVVRSASNEPIAWVKTAPERFEPRRVRTQPLDAGRVLVTEGLAGGERVVVSGAALLNQVR